MNDDLRKDKLSPMVSQSDEEHRTSTGQSDESPRVVIEFQGVSQQVIAQVWEQLKSGVTPEGPAFTLARSMVDHQHWYAYYETIGIFESGETAYPDEVDPFLHVNLHFLIGFQVLNASPPGARGFYIARERRGDDPHEVIHMMMEAFQRHLVWTAMNAGPEGQFDMGAYEDTLEVLKTLDRGELWERLGYDEPPVLHPEAQRAFHF